MSLPSEDHKFIDFAPKLFAPKFEVNLVKVGGSEDVEKSLEERVSAIEERNHKVELDKAWEGSWIRKGLIIAFTFISIGLYMWAIGVQRPWLNAVIPSLGFTLSTLTLPFFKELWKKYVKKEN